MYSAIKVNGKKLYEYARKGQKIEVAPREIEIYQLQIDRIDDEQKEITFTVDCSKGTYIRTLCETIAEKLGYIGCMKELTRTKVGDFLLTDCITIEELKQLGNNQEALEKKMMRWEDLFENTKRIVLEDRQLELFLNGVKLETNETQDILCIYNKEKKFMGTAQVKNGTFKRDVIVSQD